MGLLDSTLRNGSPQSFEFDSEIKDFRRMLFVERSLANRYDAETIRGEHANLFTDGKDPLEYAKWWNDRTENIIIKVRIKGEWHNVPITSEQKNKSLEYYRQVLDERKELAAEALNSFDFFAKRGEFEKANDWQEQNILHAEMAEEYAKIIAVLEKI